MATTRSEGEVKKRWEDFVHGFRSMFAMLPQHRHQDQFLRVKEAALALAEGPQMGAEIEQGYRAAVLSSNSQPLLEADAVEVAVMELEAFPLAVQVHQAEEKSGTAKPGAGKRLRAAGKTILGSVGELFKLSEYGKKVIVVMKEALELFGDD